MYISDYIMNCLLKVFELLMDFIVIFFFYGVIEVVNLVF